ETAVESEDRAWGNLASSFFFDCLVGDGVDRHVIPSVARDLGGGGLAAHATRSLATLGLTSSNCCKHCNLLYARIRFFVAALNRFRKSNRFFPTATAFHRSPIFSTRCRTLSMRKSSMRTPFSISSHFTGVDTEATGVGRIE